MKKKISYFPLIKNIKKCSFDKKLKNVIIIFEDFLIKIV